MKKIKRNHNRCCDLQDAVSGHDLVQNTGQQLWEPIQIAISFLSFH